MVTQTRRPESATINYLRGLAAFGVVLFHVRTHLWVGFYAIQNSTSATPFEKAIAWLSAPTPFLGSGVPLFFLISGFCIALPYAGQEGRNMNWGEYMARRFFRIYPPYFCAILLTIGIDILLLILGFIKNLPSYSYGTSFLMIQNYTTGQIPTNGSLWSLPIEMELYVAFPVIYYLQKKKGNAIMIFCIALASLISLYFYISGYTFLGVNFAKYWLLWSTGAVIAEYYVIDKLITPSKYIGTLGIISLLLAVGGHIKGIDPGILDFIYGFSFAILLWLGLTTETKWKKFVPKYLDSFFNLLGTCSYSLYLIHYPLLKLFGRLWELAFGQKPVNFLIPLVFSFITIILSWFFYKVIEERSHRLAKHMAVKFT